MAAYDNLPAYKAGYDLLLEIFTMNMNLTKAYRYTLGSKLENELTDLLTTIYKANVSEQEKETNLRLARERIVRVRLYMRMLHDLKQIPLKRFVALGEKVEDLSRQITAWHKSAIKKSVQS